MAKRSNEQLSIIQSKFSKNQQIIFQDFSRTNFSFKDFQGLEFAAFRFKYFQETWGPI